MPQSLTRFADILSYLLRSGSRACLVSVVFSGLGLFYCFFVLSFSLLLLFVLLPFTFLPPFLWRSLLSSFRLVLLGSYVSFSFSSSSLSLHLIVLSSWFLPCPLAPDYVLAVFLSLFLS